LSREKLAEALPLVWNVFLEFEAVDYPESGKRAFWDAVHSEEYLDMLTAYGAYEGETLVGIIASRSGGSHLALFFVDGKHHKQGIGRSLWDVLLADNSSPVITVHSSVYAVPVYQRFGFAVTGEACEDGGIRYVPMEYRR